MTSYPAGMYPEQLPSWLGFVTTWAGRRAPDTTSPFRVLDLGCGVGLTACWTKRAYPHAEVVGLDADRAHIDASEELAASLPADVAFVHGSFAAARDLGPFDIVVAHGVWSWVGDAGRAELLEVLREVLAEGGLFYVDYNALPGRSDWTALAGLVRTLVPVLPGDDEAALAQALGALEAMEGLGVFARRRGLVEGLLESLRWQPGYLVHEFLSAGWDAFHLADVARMLAPVGVDYVASTHLYETVAPYRTTEEERTHLTRWSDPVVRHTVRDALRDTAFRHDVFQRGGTALSAAARQAALLERHYALGRAPASCSLARPGQGGHPLPEAARPVLAALDGPPRIGHEVVSAVDLEPHQVVATLGLLCAAGFVFPADRHLHPHEVDDAMASATDPLPVLSPSGIEITFSPVDRALWRARHHPDPLGRALELLAAEGRRLPGDPQHHLDAFRAAVPALVRAGWTVAQLGGLAR